MDTPSALRVLVLDDETFMLKLLTHMLGAQGVPYVKACEDGPSALACLNQPEACPDLILLDLNMPGMDGVEFVRNLVEHQYAGSLILVSGEDERVLKTAENLVKAHQISVLGHLRKPVTPQKLAEVMEKWTLPRKPPSGGVRKLYASEEIRAALDLGELTNFYQPKVAVATGRVVGVESLVRWRHPAHGLVFPDQFIGIAESTGLIDDVTRCVLSEAVAQAKSWRDAGIHLRVAVNVSMDNLSSLGFAEFVTRLAADAELPPGDLVLEVTESRLMRDLRASLETLTRLRLRRFHLSIDDFGTGHSSLAQLRDIPFDELKIDQSFVHGAWADETIRAMYDASLGLANQLGMEVVAEGVEDEEDWEFLRRTGCPLAQGYFIARPMQAGDLTAWIETWEGRYANGPVPEFPRMGRP